ncbi:MAG: hypothetical protein LBH44_11670 [Treponema sp.]|jgi:preprotein translocase subunit Sss1|nr:hypothetical protein [Treponema sp.]
METSTAENLTAINRTLEKHNEIAQKMLEVMQKPENPFFKVLAAAGLGVGALGIIHVIDTILKWL